MNKKTYFLGIEVIIFLFASVSFFFGFQILAADFYDFSHLWRMLPAILSYFSPVYWLFIIHLLISHQKSKKLLQTSLINAIVLISLGAIIALIVIIYLGVSLYPIDGMINSLFPIDLLLINLISIAFGIALIYYYKKIKNKDDLEVVPKTKLWKKILSSIFFPFYSLIALYEMGSILLGFDFASYGSEEFAASIPAYIAMISLSIFLLLREIHRLYEIKIEGRKLQIYSISLFVLGVFIGVLPLFMLLVSPTYPELNFHPYYPLDFMGSLRISIYLWSIPNILGPIFFFFIPTMKAFSLFRKQK